MHNPDIQENVAPKMHLNDPCVAGALEIFERCKNLLIERGQQYGGGLQVRDYMPHGLLSFHQMMHIKLARFHNGIKVNAPVTSLLDSLMDLINYAAFTCGDLMDLEQQRDKAMTRITPDDYEVRR